MSNSSIIRTRGIIRKTIISNCCIPSPSGVVIEGRTPIRGVVVSSDVGDEGTRSIRGVGLSSGVGVESILSICGIIVCRCISI